MLLTAQSNMDDEMRIIAFSKLAEYINMLANLAQEAISLCIDIGGSQEMYGPLSTNKWVAKHLGLEDYCDVPAYYQDRLIMMTFLWTAWQRSVMLLLYFTVKARALEGHAEHLIPELPLGGNVILNCHSLRFDFLREPQMPQYMCPWALSLLRSRRNFAGLDVRRLLCRYQQQFGDRHARCLPQLQQQCKGSSPEECQRFLTYQPDEQHFAHDVHCSSSWCRRIKWDEVSYRCVFSPRAVHVRPGFWRLSDMLTYCQARTKTLAVSHVWSHGQGGRPEDGLNLCLHYRYCQIAEDHLCDSYWIDTACIPNDKALRTEAIKKINEVFQNSMITLICDQNLMSLDVPEATDTKKWETIIATLLVCDWNIRAWTLLEAVKGNANSIS